MDPPREGPLICPFCREDLAVTEVKRDLGDWPWSEKDLKIYLSCTRCEEVFRVRAIAGTIGTRDDAYASTYVDYIHFIVNEGKTAEPAGRTVRADAPARRIRIEEAADGA